MNFFSGQVRHGGDTGPVRELLDRIAELEEELRKRPTVEAHRRVRRERDEAKEALVEREESLYSVVDASDNYVLVNVRDSDATAKARKIGGAVINPDGSLGWNFRQHGGVRKINRS